MKRSYSRAAAVAVAAVDAALAPAIAWAQAGPPSGGGAPDTVTVPAPAPAAPQTPGGYSGLTGSFGNPQSPNGTIGGGNATESSAHPITGDKEDSFDLGSHAGSSGAAHGDANGPIFVGGSSFGIGGSSYGIGGSSYGGGEVPYSHVVRRGDTLWGICGFYFQNPYQWPRIWSFNPQIKNPHWIYPSDEVRLKEGGASDAGAQKGAAPPHDTGKMTLVDRRRQVPSDTIFLRDQGWIRDEDNDVWGNVSGATVDKMFLSDFDEVYLHIDGNHEVKLGQELTVFRPLKIAAAGTIVQIQGTARIDQWNPQDRIARARIVESLNVIERGAKIGPIARRFAIVPPKRNEVDVQAHVLASVHPNEFWGQNQVVFIDRGEEAGLKLGNLLFIVRRGDAWRRTLVTPGAGYRVSPEDERPMPPMEPTPGSRHDEDRYPDEVVGELRVVSLRKDTATCVVTEAKGEIETYDLAVARKGY